MIGLGAIGILVIVIAVLLMTTRDDAADPTVMPPTIAAPVSTDSPSTPIATPAANPIATPLATPAASPVATPLASPAPSVNVDCDLCLVRLPDVPEARAFVTSVGARPSYAHDGVMWAPIPMAEMGKLAGFEPAPVVADASDTLGLHVMRVPDGGDPAPILESGELLDQIGRQYLVRVPDVPFAASGLTSIGIAVEKVLPSLPPIEVNRTALPRLTDLSEIQSMITTEHLTTTVAELQGSGAADGGLGTRYYASPGNVVAAEYLVRRFADYGLDVSYDDFVTNDGLLALNVLAEIPGSDPSQIYLVMGHFDSTTDGGPVAPGADDNATGIAAMLEIARVLSRFQLPHPVRFLATNVEEVGIQGAPSFAARAVDTGVPYAGAFNIDAVGSTANGSLLILNADENSIWLEDLLIDINDRFGLGQELRVRQNPFIVADDNSLRDYGIATVLLAREVYGWSATHHTPDDVIETVDFDNVRTATELVALAVASLLIEG